MAKELRDLIENAAADIDHYKRPNVDEAKTRLTELLNAAGLGGIGEFDRIESISEEDGMLHISTSYVLRGCECGERYEIPSSVIDSEDPIKAATEWGLAIRTREAEDKVAEARRNLQSAEKKLAEVRGDTAPQSPAVFDAFKDLAGRLGWDTEQQHAGGHFRDATLQTIWDSIARNPAAGGKASA